MEGIITVAISAKDNNIEFISGQQCDKTKGSKTDRKSNKIRPLVSQWFIAKEYVTKIRAVLSWWAILKFDSIRGTQVAQARKQWHNWVIVFDIQLIQENQI